MIFYDIVDQIRLSLVVVCCFKSYMRFLRPLKHEICRNFQRDSKEMEDNGRMPLEGFQDGGHPPASKSSKYLQVFLPDSPDFGTLSLKQFRQFSRVFFTDTDNNCLTTSGQENFLRCTSFTCTIPWGIPQQPATAPKVSICFLLRSEAYCIRIVKKSSEMCETKILSCRCRLSCRHHCRCRGCRGCGCRCCSGKTWT